MNKKRLPPKETWAVYHRKDRTSKIENATDNANVIFSSTPDTERMGLGSEIADLSGSNFIESKANRHAHLIGAAKELHEAVVAWMKVETESKANNPCPDYGLRAVYHKKALKLSKIALKKALPFTEKDND